MSKQSETINHNDFIEIYKEYEATIRDVLNVSPFDYENEQDETTKKQLQIIRLNRNYIQHEKDKNFVSVNEKQIELLQSIINKVKSSKGVVKDYMLTLRKYGSLSSDNTLKEVSTVFAKTKREQLPVIDSKTGDFLGMLTNMEFIRLVAENTSMTTKLVSNKSKTKPVSLMQIPIISSEMPICDLLEDTSKTNAVTKGKKLIGILELS